MLCFNSCNTNKNHISEKWNLTHLPSKVLQCLEQAVLSDFPGVQANPFYCQSKISWNKFTLKLWNSLTISALLCCIKVENFGRLIILPHHETSFHHCNKIQELSWRVTTAKILTICYYYVSAGRECYLLELFSVLSRNLNISGKCWALFANGCIMITFSCHLVRTEMYFFLSILGTEGIGPRWCTKWMQYILKQASSLLVIKYIWCLKRKNGIPHAKETLVGHTIISFLVWFLILTWHTTNYLPFLLSFILQLTLTTFKYCGLLGKGVLER